jgi:hypothetical protein
MLALAPLPPIAMSVEQMGNVVSVTQVTSPIPMVLVNPAPPSLGVILVAKQVSTVILAVLGIMLMRVLVLPAVVLLPIVLLVVIAPLVLVVTRGIL